MEFAEAQMKDLLEPLHPDLVPWVEHNAEGAMLRHPLVFQVPLFSNGKANRIYEQKLLQIANLIALNTEESRARTIWLTERPYRLNQFLSQAIFLSDAGFWKTLKEVWVDTENAWQNIETWSALFNSTRGSRENLMDAQELEVFNLLEDEVEVYRGCKAGLNENGISWTLDLSKAVWFSKRLHQEGEGTIVLNKIVKKSEILALFLGRGEQEVILKLP